MSQHHHQQKRRRRRVAQRVRQAFDEAETWARQNRIESFRVETDQLTGLDIEVTTGQNNRGERWETRRVVTGYATGMGALLIS
jgi:hypothetical protein